MQELFQLVSVHLPETVAPIIAPPFASRTVMVAHGCHRAGLATSLPIPVISSMCATICGGGGGGGAWTVILDFLFAAWSYVMLVPVIPLTVNVMPGEPAIVATWLVREHTPLALVTQLPVPDAPLLQFPETVAPLTAPPLAFRTVTFTVDCQLPGTVAAPLPVRSSIWARIGGGGGGVVPGAATAMLDFLLAAASYVMFGPEMFPTTNVMIGNVAM